MMIANAIILLCVRNYFKRYILTHLFSKNLTVIYYLHFTDDKTGAQVGSPSGDHTASKFGTMIQKLGAADLELLFFF